MAGWHLAGGGGQLLHNRADYASFAFQGALWLVMAVAIAVGSVLVLRGSLDWRLAWTVAIIALVASTASAAASPAGQMLAVSWAWGSAGWIGVLVLHRRRLAELAWFLAAEAAAILGVQAWDGLDRLDLAAFLALLAWSTGAQIAVAAAVKALDVGRRPGRHRGAERGRRPRAGRHRGDHPGRPAGPLAGAPGKHRPAGGRAGGGDGRPGRPAAAGQVRGPGGQAPPADGGGR